MFTMHQVHSHIAQDGLDTNAARRNFRNESGETGQRPANQECQDAPEPIDIRLNAVVMLNKLTGIYLDFAAESLAKGSQHCCSECLKQARTVGRVAQHL